MGACFSSEYDQYDQQHSFRSNQDEIQQSSTENSLEIPPKQSVSDVKDLRQNPGYSNLDSFTYAEMRMATKLFRKDAVLGEGGFGFVYKGTIDECVRPDYPTTEVAIKELNHQGFQGDKEWLTEVNYLGHVQHPNLVKLIGYCCEDDHRLLVYEYMAAGCVEKHLFGSGSKTLTWSRRMKIALDAAKGLAFLHNAERPIIFRDFKTSNILLDADFNAKLSDFGLAKDGPMGAQTHVSTRVKGTQGYAAPEYAMSGELYAMSGHLTASCDIYAFGVVLLEMLTGQRAFDISRPSGENYLVDWTRPVLVQSKKAVLGIMDPRIKGQYSYKAAIKVADLAYICIRQHPKRRPRMSQVVEALELVQTPEVPLRSKGDGKNEASNGD